MGEGRIEVIRIGQVDRHPNADRLSITRVHGKYPCIFQAGDYKEGDLAVYLPVDSIVPETEEWAWLGDKSKHRRIKAKRLRGFFSMGLLTAAPAGTVEGQDVAALLGITRFDDEPVAPTPKAIAPKTVGEKLLAWLLPHLPSWMVPRSLFNKYLKASSNLYRPKGLALPGVYDLEPFRRFGRDTFTNGELVVITEKIHGQNAGFVSHKGKLYLRSRTQWRSTEPGSSTWADVAHRYDLAEKLAKVPGVILYGETYGNNADMPYGVDRNKTGDAFVAFDAFNTETKRWLNHYELVKICVDLGIPLVPSLGQLVWSEGTYEYLQPFAEGKTTMPGARGAHVREGIVIKAANERSPGVPRAILKLVGGYHTRKEAQ